MFFNRKYSPPLANFSKAENKSMFVITRPPQLKCIDPKLFLQKSAKIIEGLTQNFHDFLVTATSCICLLKSQIFAQFICHKM